jgi:hypothetical protein
MRVFFVVMRMSVLSASSSPPPSAIPSIRHSTGKGKFITSLNILRRLKTISSISSLVLSSRYFKSAPEQKWPGSLLWRITARMVLSLVRTFNWLSNYIWWGAYLVEQSYRQCIFLLWLVQFDSNNILIRPSKSTRPNEISWRRKKPSECLSKRCKHLIIHIKSNQIFCFSVYSYGLQFTSWYIAVCYPLSFLCDAITDFCDLSELLLSLSYFYL